jgi:large subunit ribosomal protein L21
MPPTYPPGLRAKQRKEKGEKMFAVIKNGGRQYKVSVGQKLSVNRLPIEAGQQISIGEVILISDAEQTRVGAPFVENAAVLATVEGDKRGEKLTVFKYKSKKRYRHRRGHRQELTVLAIDDILADGKSLITGEAPKAKEEVVAAEQVSEPEVAETTTTAEEAPAPEKRTRRRTSKASETKSSTEE